MNRCDDCSAHSGIDARIHMQERTIERVEERLHQLLIGILLCIITGLVSSGTAIYISMESRIARHDSIPYIEESNNAGDLAFSEIVSFKDIINNCNERSSNGLMSEYKNLKTVYEGYIEGENLTLFSPFFNEGVDNER